MDFDAAWRGLATLAGSWIGGGANQTAMLELYQYNPSKYGAMITVDIVVANIWMALILLGAGKSAKIDRWLKADSSAIDDLKDKMENYSSTVEKNTTFQDLIKIAAIALGGVGLSHFLGSFLVKIGDVIPYFADTVLTSHFFWVCLLYTSPSPRDFG